jgi:hypothetical protein
MTEKDVKAWCEFNGVSHVVASAKSGWIHTACNSLMPGRWTKTRTTKRKCRACMLALAGAKPMVSGR